MGKQTACATGEHWYAPSYARNTIRETGKGGEFGGGQVAMVYDHPKAAERVRLIAAAPKLLAACQQVQRAAGYELNSPERQRQMSIALGLVRDAITQAEGAAPIQAKGVPEDRATALLRSLVADIDAMQVGGQKLWFGPFSEFDFDTEDTGVEVGWPNLAILRDEAKALLAEVIEEEPVR